MADDDALTVKEALAFIDAFDEAAEQEVRDEGAGATSSERGRQSCSRSRDADRKKRNSQAVRRCQRRKKQEMVQLRAQVQALEEHLKQLQEARRRQRVCSSWELEHVALLSKETAGLESAARGVWATLAQREMIQRQRSETLNLQLRAALAKHRDLSAALQSVVRAGSIDTYKLESLLRDEPPAPPLYSTPQRIFSMDYILADLALTMEKLYIDADSMLRHVRVDSTDAQEDIHVQLKQDPDHGEYVEVTQALEFPMSMEKVSSIIWKGMTTHNIENDMVNIKMRAASDTDAHKSSEIVLDDPLRLLRFKLDAISYTKKFEEAEKHLLMFTSLVTVTDWTGIRFRDKLWIELTRSCGDPSGRSVIRLCYRYTSEAPALMKSPELDTPSESELRRTRAFLLHAVGAKIQGENVKIRELLFSQVE